MSCLPPVVEPYLIQKGFIVKTPRGRVVVEEGIKAVKQFV